MLIENKDIKKIIANTLVNIHIFNRDYPVMITFSPAGAVLSKRKIDSGANAWAFDYFKKNKINIIAFSAIEEKHWFVCDELLQYIDALGTELQCFSERLGYGASMGAYALSIYFNSLHIDRLLLITPLPACANFNERTGFNYSQNFMGQLTIIFDPLCPNDKKQALLYPAQAKYLKFPGVGHQVIESLSHLRLLSPLLRSFIDDNIDPQQWSLNTRKRRTLRRYYSYMARNPTNKGGKKRRGKLKRAYFGYVLKHPSEILLKITTKWKKSINKKIKRIHRYIDT